MRELARLIYDAIGAPLEKLPIDAILPIAKAAGLMSGELDHVFCARGAQLPYARRRPTSTGGKPG